MPESGNAEAYSVSDLAFALKRTLEDAYGYVRIRGEISKVTRHASGHTYLTLKDERAAIDGVIWRGQTRGVSVRPETGLEVIASGRITTYPLSSKYQIVIESLEAAGVGALLAQLERLRVRLAAEGLFETSRKRPLPPAPTCVGVITSPTGAVIRDILHRVRDRWPCHVLVWPTLVQGELAAAQVAAAIRGFNALPPGGRPPRPDVIIVARGGGSVEDLWAFNDEALVRAVAASEIPVISAVGHETDTTLIDFAADRRAPTPTAAAELATPVLADLRAATAQHGARLLRSLTQRLDLEARSLESAARGLPRPAGLTALPVQRLDAAAQRLGAALERNASAHERALLRRSSRLTPVLLMRAADRGRERVAAASRRLSPAVARTLDRAATRLEGLEKTRLVLNPDRPLSRGFARIHAADGALVRHASDLRAGDRLKLVFADGARRAEVIPDESHGGA